MLAANSVMNPRLDIETFADIFVKDKTFKLGKIPLRNEGNYSGISIFLRILSEKLQ